MFVFHCCLMYARLCVDLYGFDASFTRRGHDGRRGTLTGGGGQCCDAGDCWQRRLGFRRGAVAAVFVISFRGLTSTVLEVVHLYVLMGQ